MMINHIDSNRNSSKLLHFILLSPPFTDRFAQQDCCSVTHLRMPTHANATRRIELLGNHSLSEKRFPSVSVVVANNIQSEVDSTKWLDRLPIPLLASMARSLENEKKTVLSHGPGP